MEPNAHELDLDDVLRFVLRSLMREHGWSERELAKQVGVSQQGVNRLFHGGGASLWLVSRVCRALKEPVTTLLERHPAFRQHTALPDRTLRILTELERRGILEQALTAQEALLRLFDAASPSPAEADTTDHEKSYNNR